LTERERGLRYLLVGAWNTVFGFGVFALLQLTLGDSINYIFLLAIAQVVATLNAFTGYRLLVFRVQGDVLRDLARFSTVYLGAFAVNLAALPLLVELAGVPVLIAQAGVVGATVVASYFMHRGFSFRRPEPTVAEGDLL
jgi:putative flippase GtrA